eukprot:Skav214135  [mRNA]  locus=scaffold1185:732129:734708:+ [translate_table: standard]
MTPHGQVQDHEELLVVGEGVGPGGPNGIRHRQVQLQELLPVHLDGDVLLVPLQSPGVVMLLPLSVDLPCCSMENSIACLARLVRVDDTGFQHALEGVHNVDLAILRPWHCIEIPNCPPRGPCTRPRIDLRSHLQLSIGKLQLST